MKQVVLLTAFLIAITGLLISGLTVAQAGERILLASAGSARFLSDKELGAVTGGELTICGPSSQRDKSCGNNKDARTQIILWDERGPLGRPSQSSSGSYTTTTGGSMSFRSDVRVSN